jgi:hypothetical protein
MMRFLRSALALVVVCSCSTDTFVGGDGSADASSDTSAADASCGPSFCATQALSQGTVCTDFDESSSVPTDWTQELLHGGSVSITSSSADACQSLQALMPSQPDAGQTGNSLARISKLMTVAGTSAHATLDLDVLLPTNDTMSYAFFFGIRAGNVTIGLTHHGDPYWFVSSSPASVNLALATAGPVLGKWTHMTFDLKYETAQTTVSLTYVRADTNAQDNVTGSAPVGATGVPNAVTFQVGIEAPGFVETNLAASYDNVIATLVP